MNDLSPMLFVNTRFEDGISLVDMDGSERIKPILLYRVFFNDSSNDDEVMGIFFMFYSVDKGGEFKDYVSISNVLRKNQLEDNIFNFFKSEDNRRSGKIYLQEGEIKDEKLSDKEKEAITEFGKSFRSSVRTLDNGKRIVV